MARTRTRPTPHGFSCCACSSPRPAPRRPAAPRRTRCPRHQGTTVPPGRRPPVGSGPPSPRAWLLSGTRSGRSQCAGPMGSTIRRICPYVDAVVHVEGEQVLGELVRRFRDGRSLSGLAGVSRRTEDGEVVTAPAAELVVAGSRKLDLDYDAYFHRLARLGLTEKMNPWLPFESSRGCWYGQKVQCTFCGLHDIMDFRVWDADVVLAQLESLQKRYGVGRFYSMDLIMPREYLRNLLPEIAARGHDWMFFYEIEANMRRSEPETLAAAGVRWVQPGIESLDADLLSLMRKGVKPYQNVQLLKWCQELGIYCGWNLLFGLPGEGQASYTRMAELIPKLTHLQPPSGGGRFQLHRFSPYFEQPEAHGARWEGMHRMFAYAFPADKADLDQLVYLHDFTLDPSLGDPVDTSEVEAAVVEWRRANQAGARLDFIERSDEEGVIVDHRDVGSPPVRYPLDRAGSALYRHLDAGVAERLLAERFRDEDRDAFEALGGASGLAELVEQWLSDRPGDPHRREDPRRRLPCEPDGGAESRAGRGPGRDGARGSARQPDSSDGVVDLRSYEQAESWPTSRASPASRTRSAKPNRRFSMSSGRCARTPSSTSPSSASWRR
ncbi:RiPP maturation radical SAM C-methyltransferase [Streptomyces gardneri]|uniref:RiPP maturation radical SAM C-methyltransferase n=1 Tax=Streptomyces gardneri TaxID=66892 RepID=UPI0037D54B5F